MSFEKVWLDRPLRERVSVTMLRHENTCSRSGYLYAKHRGAGRTNDMERGTAGHRVLELATRAIVENGEHAVPPELAKAITSEVIADPAYRCPMEQHDYLRELTFRWASEFTCEPENVVAVEQFMVLELPNGWVVRGVVDFAELLEGGAAVRAWDYKTSRALLGDEEVGRKRPDGSIAAKDFQLVLYALMLVFGRSVSFEPCPCGGRGEWRLNDESEWEPVPVASREWTAVYIENQLTVRFRECPKCENRGRIEIVGPLPLAGAAQRVDLAYVFPGIERKDGTMAQVKASLTRLELEEYRDSLLAAVERVRIAEQTGDWPAASGTHCTECPCKAECPIPTELRDFAGSINTPEQAAVVAERQERTRAIWDAIDKELKTFVKKGMGGAPLRYGRNMLMEVQKREALKERRRGARDAMFEAVERAVQYGEPFDQGEFYRPAIETRLVTRALSELELEEELRENLAREAGPDDQEVTAA